MVAVKVENLSKVYRLGLIGTGTLGSDLKRWYALKTGKEDPFLKIGQTNDRNVKGDGSIVWSLKDINFEIKQGEAVGIIGKNGAGKSTLLKILSRVTSPTTGKITGNGRVASLLEVGTGFHPELTGRDNIYLNGAILGMRKKEIKHRFDEIVEFAGVERYIDTPVKRYSSGMYVRLAFAVAAYLESEILIVDEVLAVGDAEFQKKCLGKMKDISSGEGRTVLFVSHNMDAVARLTSKSVLLNNGKIMYSGATRTAINEYFSLTAPTSLIYKNIKEQIKPYIKKVEVQTSLPNNIQLCGSEMKVEIELNTNRSIKNACFSFHINDLKDKNYAHLWIFDSDMPFCRTPGSYKLTCIIPNLKLYMGQYSIKCYFTGPPGGEIFEQLENICPFEVVMYEIERSNFEWQPDACCYIEQGDWMTEDINTESEIFIYKN